MKTETITKSLYGGEIEVIFYPNSHQYKIGKDRITSVTSITGVIDKPALKFWAAGCAVNEILECYEKGDISEASIKSAKSAFTRVSKEATDIGATVHDFCEMFALNKLGKGEKPELPEDEKALSGCLAFLRWHDQNKVEFLEVEKLVYSKKHNYCGIFDLLAKVNGKLYLIDYKTSKDFYPLEMGAQLAGYKIAFKEETGTELDGLSILRFDKETGDFAIHDIANEELSEQVFLSCLQIKNAQKYFDSLTPTI
jgi:hypothetical protein